MGLLSDVDKQRIEESIARIERQSSGEVVVALVPACAEYGLPRALAAVLWAVGAALAAHYAFPLLTSTWLLFGVVPAWALFWAVFGWRPLHRLLVPPRAAEEAASAKAFEVFSRFGLHQTREATGLLVLISELEHRVVILGDRGINGAVQQTGWQDEIKVLVEALRAGHAADGILAVLNDMGALLQARFPRRADDVNELGDRVIDET